MNASMLYELPRDRVPESRGRVSLPPGTVVVSPDSHFSISEDIWYEGFPASLRHKAPRVWQADGTFHIGFDGKSLLGHTTATALSVFETIPGASRIEPRLIDMRAEGVDQEIVFGNGVYSLMGHADLEVREWIFRVYNRHLAALAAQAPGSFHGVALLKYWDPATVREDVQEIRNLGIKALMLPLKPTRDVDGEEVFYASEKMEPLWSAIEESELPLCFHIGEFYTEGRGGSATSILANLNPFRTVLGHLIFGGIFDRHPGLRVVFVEAGINWIPGVLQDCELVIKSFGRVLDWMPRKPPRHYWENNCYATFMTDALGLSQIDLIGADRVMWSADYPHAEGTYGYGWSSIQAVLDAVPPSDARKILGGNALEAFRLSA